MPVSRWPWVACAVIAVTMSCATTSSNGAQPSQIGAARIARVERRASGLAFFDAGGRLIAADLWPGAIPDADVLQKQREYNAWVRRAVWTLRTDTDGSTHQSGVVGVDLISQHPSLYDPFQTTFQIPAVLAETGVLDRHTLSAPLYQLGTELAGLWYDLYADVMIDAGLLTGYDKQLKRTVPQGRVKAAALPSQLGYLTTPLLSSVYLRTINPPAANEDPKLLMARYWEIRSGVDRLMAASASLSNLDQRTAAGAVVGPGSEQAFHAERLSELTRKSAVIASAVKAGIPYTLPPQIWSDPPDFLTSFIPLSALSAPLINGLNTAEAVIRSHIWTARLLAAESTSRQAVMR